MKLVLLILSFQAVSLRAFAPNVIRGNQLIETNLNVEKCGGFVENLLNPLGAAILFTSVLLQPDDAFAEENRMVMLSNAGSYQGKIC